MSKNNLCKKGFVYAIVILFIGICIYPAYAKSPITFNYNIKGKYIGQVEETKAKRYLFQTIIGIAYNPDVEALFEQYEGRLIDIDFDFNSFYAQLLIKNPSLSLNVLFTKPSITYDYLDSIYDRGCKIANILGEEKFIEMIESIEIINSETFNRLDIIIKNNRGLNNRILTLAEMNKELKPNPPFKYNSIICAIWEIMLYPLLYLGTFLYVINFIFEDFFRSLIDLFENILSFFVYLGGIFECYI